MHALRAIHEIYFNSWSEAKIHENEAFNALHLRLPRYARNDGALKWKKLEKIYKIGVLVSYLIGYNT